MNKETFQKKWYYKLLQVAFFGSLMLFSLFLIIAGIFDSDVEIAGFFWAGILCLVYWLIKRVLYSVMFKERIFGKGKKGFIIGFILGVVVALIWIFIMTKIYPNEDFAGIVIIASLICGLILGFMGYLTQNYLRNRREDLFVHPWA